MTGSQPYEGFAPSTDSDWSGARDVNRDYDDAATSSAVDYATHSPAGLPTSFEHVASEMAVETASGASVGHLLPAGSDRGVIDSFTSYMRLKKDKLLHQINVIGKPVDRVSQIFQGLSFFVNGYTVPSSLELRSLIQANGGSFHVYHEPGTTSFIIASSLAEVKKSKTVASNDIILRPEFIVDSVAAGRLVDEEDYFLLSEQKEKRRKRKREEAEENTPSTSALHGDARDASFIDSYYARSRLHLISTLAQEMKDYVSDMRSQRLQGAKSPSEVLEEIRRVIWTMRNPGEMEVDERGWDDEEREERREKGEEGEEGEISESSRLVMHIDLDCFFVSVALRTRPELRGRPVAITHSSGSTKSNGFSEVASCSYAARARGIRNGCLVRDALARCPDLVCLPYQFDEYRQVSRAIYDIVSSLTLEIRAVSCDEMFVDATGLVSSAKGVTPRALANLLRRRIFEATGCPASVGQGPNALIARLATRLAKPDGVYWVPVNRVDHFMAAQKITDIPSIGYSTLSRLSESFGSLQTCSQLQAVSEESLRTLLGKNSGSQLYRLCRGIDDTPIILERERKSVSCDINYGIRFQQREELVQFLHSLGKHLEQKLAASAVIAGQLTLKLMTCETLGYIILSFNYKGEKRTNYADVLFFSVRAADAPVQTAKYLGHGKCDSHSKSARLSPPTVNPKILAATTLRLLDSVKAPITDLRGIGVQLSRLQSTRLVNQHPTNSAVEGIQKFLRRGEKATISKDDEEKERRKEEGDESERDEEERRDDESSQCVHDIITGEKDEKYKERSGRRSLSEEERSSKPLLPALHELHSLVRNEDVTEPLAGVLANLIMAFIESDSHREAQQFLAALRSFAEMDEMKIQWLILVECIALEAEENARSSFPSDTDLFSSGDDGFLSQQFCECISDPNCSV